MFNLADTIVAGLIGLLYESLVGERRKSAPDLGHNSDRVSGAAAIGTAAVRGRYDDTRDCVSRAASAGAGTDAFGGAPKAARAPG
jgi:hypothetical protein